MVYVSDMITHKIRCQHVSYGVAYSLFCNLYTGHWSFTLMFPQTQTKYQRIHFVHLKNLYWDLNWRITTSPLFTKASVKAPNLGEHRILCQYKQVNCYPKRKDHTMCSSLQKKQQA